MLLCCSFTCSFLPLRIILFAYIFNLLVIQENKVIPKELEREENPNMVESTLAQDGGGDVFLEVGLAFYNLPHKSLNMWSHNCVFYVLLPITTTRQPADCRNTETDKAVQNSLITTNGDDF